MARATFAVDGPDLLVGGVPVARIAAHTGTPAYIHDGGVMRRNFRALAAALGGFAEIYYSVKANPAPAIVRLFLEEGAGMEIASVGEFRTALAAGTPPERILFAGPGKGRHELEEVIEGGIGEIHIESYEEIARIDAIGKPVKAAIRINPVPTVQAGAMRMGGKPTAFGFDEEDLGQALAALAAARNIELVGVHIYGGTQILDADALIGQWRHAITLASRVAAEIGRPLRTIDLGGGLGIPYYAGEAALDLDLVAAQVPALCALVRADPMLAETRLIVEPGRFLTGNAGIYVAQINTVKHSRGARFVVTDGGMHHHLAASGNLGQIIKRDYPVVAPARMDDADVSQAIVAGPLCTPLDTLARDTSLPALVAGDLIAILQSGAYGLTASPVHFLGHAEPVGVIAEDGRFEVVALYGSTGRPKGLHPKHEHQSQRPL